MNKLFKTLRALSLIAKNPWLLNKILDEDKQWQKRVEEKYALGQGLPVVRAENLFGDFSETISPYASLDGSSLPTDLALLRKLARSFDRCSYFEIGTWRGESVANVAAVAEECYSLNLSADQLGKLGMDGKYIGLHRHFSSHLENVTHLEGDSREFDFASLNKKFDLIFIDGDHHYEIVKSDTEKVFRHLLHQRSVVVWHDYAYNPERIRFEVMMGILDGCPKEFHHRIYHAANTMCAIYMNRETGSVPFNSPQVPEGFFEVTIDWKGTL
jgi:predicted O-methyltransferase YrrM